MALLALARNLDFGPEITSAGRDFAKAHGWYPERREYQRAVDILLATGCGALALSVLAFRPWRERGRIVASCLFLALLAYVAIRAVSYHNVDQLLYNRSIDGVRINAIIELALIGAIGATTVRWPTGPARRQSAISRQPTNT